MNNFEAAEAISLVRFKVVAYDQFPCLGLRLHAHSLDIIASLAVEGWKHVNASPQLVQLLHFL